MRRFCSALFAGFFVTSASLAQSNELKFALADTRGCQIIFPLQGASIHTTARARLGKVAESARCVDKKIDGAAVFGMEIVSVMSGVPSATLFVQARFIKAGLPAELFVSFGSLPDGSPWASVGGRNYLPKDQAAADLMLARIKSAASSPAEADFLTATARLWLSNPSGFLAEYLRDWGGFVVSETLQVDDPKARGRSARGG